MKDLEFADQGLRLVITDEVTEGFINSVASINLYNEAGFLGGMELNCDEAVRVAEKLLRFVRKGS